MGDLGYQVWRKEAMSDVGFEIMRCQWIDPWSWIKEGTRRRKAKNERRRREEEREEDQDDISRATGPFLCTGLEQG